MSEDIRKTVRIVLINHRMEVLLVRYVNTEPLDPARPELLKYWVPPGGGIEAGESAERALERELREELTIEEFEIDRVIWTRQLDLMLNGKLRHIDETYYVGSYNGKAMLSVDALREGIVDVRWWGITKLRTTTEKMLPPGLPDLLAPILDRKLPPKPIEIE